jgi:predicted lactoylglutathione lyase
MKLKSVSGLTFFVKDINKTAKFYEALGFGQINMRKTIFWSG